MKSFLLEKGIPNEFEAVPSDELKENEVKQKYFIPAVAELTNTNTLLATGAVNELKSMDVQLQMLEAQNPEYKSNEKYQEYCKKLNAEAAKLALAIKDGHPDKLKKAID